MDCAHISLPDHGKALIYDAGIPTICLVFGKIEISDYPTQMWNVIKIFAGQ